MDEAAWQQHTEDYNRYLASKLIDNGFENPPDYMNDAEAVKQARAKIKELGLEERYQETVRGMEPKPALPEIDSQFQVFAMTKMFRLLGEEKG
jgi:hypothetical protein